MTFNRTFSAGLCASVLSLVTMTSAMAASVPPTVLSQSSDMPAIKALKAIGYIDVTGTIDKSAGQWQVQALNTSSGHLETLKISSNGAITASAGWATNNHPSDRTS